MHRILAILLALRCIAPMAAAQESAPVTVDASPSAAELLRRAEEAAPGNPAEAARLVQEAVERFSRKLVPWPPVEDRFRSAQAAAIAFLRENPPVLDRWMREQAPVAERQLAEGNLEQVVELRPLAPSALQAACALAQRAMDQGQPRQAVIWIDQALAHPSLDEALRARLQRARALLVEAPAAPKAATPPASSVPATPTVWQPLWARDLPTSWLSRRVAEMDPQTAQRMRDSLLGDGTALAAAPRFAGDALLLADGAQVQALDRFSGSALWKSQAGLPGDRTPGPLGDLTVAVAGDEAVIVLPGHALPEQRSGSPRIEALARDNGRRLWDVRLDLAARPDFEDLFPHGEPVLVGDLVIVQARKSNARLESAAWLLALDRASGAIRWAQSLGAAGGVRLAASRPLGSPAAIQDDIVAATSLGVVARLDAITGDMRWLRRWAPPVREPRGGVPAWQLPSPVADARLITWIAPDSITMVGLDATDGHTLWTQPIGVGTAIGAARTLLLDAERVYAIGDDVVALDRADPSHIVWRLSERLAGGASTIRGEVSLGTLASGSPALVVPLQDRVLILDPASGGSLGQLAIEGGGNTALQNGQLAVAGGARLSLAMPADEGEQLLRQRLAMDPSDPRRGLALVELGRAWRRGTLMIDGATAADAALRGRTDAESQQIRGELLSRLLERALLSALPEAEANALIGFARTAARTPAQRAAVLLCQGEQAAFRQHMPEAVAAWIEVWNDAALAASMVSMDAGWQVNAGTLALLRLASGDAGRTAGFDAAVQRLAASLQDPAALLDALRQATTLAAGPAQRERLRALVRSAGAVQAAPGLQEGIDALLQGDPQPARANIGTLEATARTLPGMLARQSAEADIERPAGSVLLAEPTAIALRRGAALEQVWRVPFIDREPVVASWSPALVIWSQTARDNGSLLALDPGSGATRYRIDRVADLFDPLPIADAADRSEARVITTFRAGAQCIFARGDGALVAVPLAGDGTPAWKVREDVRVADVVDSNAWGVAMIGIVGANDVSDGVRRISVRHVTDGTPWLQGDWPVELGQPRWMRLLPQGVLLAGEEGMAMASLAPELPLRWLQLDRRLRNSEDGLIASPWVVVKDRGAESRAAVGLADGAIQSAFLGLPSGAANDPVATVERVGDDLLALRMGRLAQYGVDGTLIGMDAVSGEHRYDVMCATQGSVVVADLGDREAQLAEAQPPTVLLRQFSLPQGLRAMAPPLAIRLGTARVERLDAVDGWMLVGCDDCTFAVPATANRPANPAR